MPRYYFRFMGRVHGAIGCTYPQCDARRADTLEQALTMLYDTYEHISPLYPVQRIDEYGQDIPLDYSIETIWKNSVTLWE